MGLTAKGAAARDLGTFNRWLALTRVRAVAGIALAVLVIAAFTREGDPSVVRPLPALVICGIGLAISMIALRSVRVQERSARLFAVQTACDLALVTIGLQISASGTAAMVFRGLYVLILIPISLITVPGGLATWAIATLAHFALLVAERGWHADVLWSVDGLTPPVVFLLVAQQCFFYGGHLAQKNRDLAALAGRLDEHRSALAAEARTAATLVEIARTLSSTLDASELLVRVTRTMSEYLEADWGATFLVDPARQTFRIAGVTDPDVPLAELDHVDFPLAGWPELARLADEPIVVLRGAAAARIPVAFRNERALGTVLLAGLHCGAAPTGFLAVGYCATDEARLEAAARLVSGIAEHAATVLHNARLLSEVRLASELKSEFVGAVSHELRSPLNVIIGYVEMLRDGELGDVGPDQHAALDRTHRQAVMLLEMITALLDLNRLEAGRLPLAAAAVDVPDMFTELLEQLPAGWARAGVRLRVETSSALPRLVTDRGKLKTVLRNLLHNALKFTPAGEIVLGATAAPAGIAFVVRDTGVGIPADVLPYIFEMFRQGPGSPGGGVGLGLHIVRRFVDALGGSVAVTSTVDRGTTFVVTLPSLDAVAHAA